MNAPPDKLLQGLAQAAGLKPVWQNARGEEQQVSAETLRTVLEALGFPCLGAAQCRESMLRLESPETRVAGLEVVRVGEPVMLRRQASLHYELLLEDGKRVMGTADDQGRGQVVIPAIRKPGYHRLRMGGLECTIAVIPERPLDVATLLSRNGGVATSTRGGTGASVCRPWVLGAQVYSLRRQVNGQGLPPILAGWEAGGDYSLLSRLAQEAGEAGAAGLAISPVHAMFSADAQRYSPYAPSSRLFLNAILADPAAVFGPEDLAALTQSGNVVFLDESGCLEWPAIQAQRLEQLQRLFDVFDKSGPQGLRDDFERYRRLGAEALNSHACYEALHAYFVPSLGAGHGWRDWPDEYQTPDSLAVRHFVETHPSQLRFHIFLQWLAARSLGKAHAEARSHTPLGLIADMAVGTDPRGSHAWSRQQQLMSRVSVGAPPDIFQPEGQNWGLTAFSPWGLRSQGYAGFIETVRAVLAHAGGLRVDHVIGLERMWLVPEGCSAAQGVYLGYPKKDLMQLLMLEAWRHQALVVGENLGTVPQGFEADMAACGFLGMNVLWFEREDGEPPRFRPPQEWPRSSMAMLTTHDLPTARGWWNGVDIRWRERHGEFDADHAARQRQMRGQEKYGLWLALQEAGLARREAILPPEAPVAAMLGFLARSPAALVHIALEDLLGEEEQPNLPGAPPDNPAAAHPNWRRTLSHPVGDLLSTGDARHLLESFRQAGRESAAQGDKS